ncbi:hypothetical protein FS827_13075 [Agrobacterium vitis]|uniref:hypothetical protein n=1 Tax=Allorhizobium ampelinum TaxID=3025782 RepID=UPI001F364E5D|nr:hypothetical protein [Allorhizobium ampelinum]MCF1462242.1 hypothetical protein [Allorhizobium ampelinum]
MKRKARLSSCQIRDESGNHIPQCGIVFCEERGSVKNRFCEHCVALDALRLRLKSLILAANHIPLERSQTNVHSPRQT